MNLLDVIPVGHENPISKEQLLLITGYNERFLRHEIERLRRNYPICNEQDGRGFYMADSIGDAMKQRVQTINRGRSLFAQIKALDKAIESYSEQTIL